MKPDQLLRAILPEVLMDNFDIDRFEKSDTRFDIWLDEKKEGQRISRNRVNDVIEFQRTNITEIRIIMKIKVRIKHLKIQKCQGKEFIVSNLKENDKCGKCKLLWSSIFKILNLSLFLFEEKEIVEKKHFVYFHVRRTLYYYCN